MDFDILLADASTFGIDTIVCNINVLFDIDLLLGHLIESATCTDVSLEILTCYK